MPWRVEELSRVDRERVESVLGQFRSTARRVLSADSHWVKALDEPGPPIELIEWIDYELGSIGDEEAFVWVALFAVAHALGGELRVAVSGKERHFVLMHERFAEPFFLESLALAPCGSVGEWPTPASRAMDSLDAIKAALARKQAMGSDNRLTFEEVLHWCSRGFDPRYLSSE